jgi:hypothetical protein
MISNMYIQKPPPEANIWTGTYLFSEGKRNIKEACESSAKSQSLDENERGLEKKIIKQDENSPSFSLLNKSLILV